MFAPWEHLSHLAGPDAGAGAYVQDTAGTAQWSSVVALITEQGKDIREMKVSLAALNERVGAFEQGVDERFEVLEGHLGPFEQDVRERFETLEGHLSSFEQSVTIRI